MVYIINNLKIHVHFIHTTRPCLNKNDSAKARLVFSFLNVRRRTMKAKETKKKTRRNGTKKTKTKNKKHKPKKKQKKKEREQKTNTKNKNLLTVSSTSSQVPSRADLAGFCLQFSGVFKIRASRGIFMHLGGEESL